MHILQVGDYLVNLNTITHVRLTRDEQQTVTSARIFFLSGLHASSLGLPSALEPGPHSLEFTGQDAALLVRALQAPQFAVSVPQ